MLRALLTFPARAAASAAWAVLTTEPLPTLVFGPVELDGTAIAEALR